MRRNLKVRNIKHEISYKAKINFLRRHKSLAREMFGDKSSYGVKPIAELARKELGYSVNTNYGDIARILYNVWKIEFDR